MHKSSLCPSSLTTWERFCCLFLALLSCSAFSCILHHGNNSQVYHLLPIDISRDFISHLLLILVAQAMLFGISTGVCRSSTSLLQSLPMSCHLIFFCLVQERNYILKYHNISTSSSIYKKKTKTNNNKPQNKMQHINDPIDLSTYIQKSVQH